MSFERAYKNCKICYLNAKSNSRDYRANELLLDSDIERSMNESMKALEGVIQQVFPFWIEATYRTPEEEFKAVLDLANTALKSCVKCDFSRPCIADLLEKEQPEIFKTETDKTKTEEE